MVVRRSYQLRVTYKLYYNAQCLRACAILCWRACSVCVMHHVSFDRKNETRSPCCRHSATKRKAIGKMVSPIQS